MKGGWLVGVVGVVVLAYITLNTLRTEGVGSRGLEPGTRLPPFAMPLAAQPLDADANIATRPDSGPEGERPACAVRGPEILNVCELAERGPGRARVRRDALGALRGPGRRARPGRPARPATCAFAAVAVRGDHERAAATVRERGWRVPVGYDHDGAVANLYGVAVCPTLTFAGRDGEVAGTALEFLDERALARTRARWRTARRCRPPPLRR